MSGSNVEMILSERFRLFVGRIPEAVRAELLSDVPSGELGHLKRDGHKPESFFHPDFDYLAKGARTEKERFVLNCGRLYSGNGEAGCGGRALIDLKTAKRINLIEEICRLREVVARKNEMIKQDTEHKHKQIDRFLLELSDDAAAATFQTIGQYRSCLRKVFLSIFETCE